MSIYGINRKYEKDKGSCRPDHWDEDPADEEGGLASALLLRVPGTRNLFIERDTINVKNATVKEDKH